MFFSQSLQHHQAQPELINLGYQAVHLITHTVVFWEKIRPKWYLLYRKYSISFFRPYTMAGPTMTVFQSVSLCTRKSELIIGSARVNWASKRICSWSTDRPDFFGQTWSLEPWICWTGVHDNNCHMHAWMFVFTFKCSPRLNSRSTATDVAFIGVSIVWPITSWLFACSLMLAK